MSNDEGGQAPASLSSDSRLSGRPALCDRGTRARGRPPASLRAPRRANSTAAGPPEEQCLEPVLLRKHPFHSTDLNGCCLGRQVGEPDSFRMSYQPPMSQLATALTWRFSQCQTMKEVRLPSCSGQNRAFRAGRPFVIDASGPGVDHQTHSGLRGGRNRRQWPFPKDNVSNPYFFRRHQLHGERSEQCRSLRDRSGSPSALTRGTKLVYRTSPRQEKGTNIIHLSDHTTVVRSDTFSLMQEYSANFCDRVCFLKRCLRVGESSDGFSC
jgi:hypothetical protein